MFNTIVPWTLKNNGLNSLRDKDAQTGKLAETRLKSASRSCRNLSNVIRAKGAFVIGINPCISVIGKLKPKRSQETSIMIVEKSRKTGSL